MVQPADPCVAGWTTLRVVRWIGFAVATVLVATGCGSSSSLPSPNVGCGRPTVRVSGTAMVPTIHDGDLLCVAPADAASLRRGDVVLMHPPNDPTGEFGKRFSACRTTFSRLTALRIRRVS